MISKWTQGWRRQRERRKETKTLTRRNDLEMRIIRCKHRADIPRLGKFVQCVQVGFWVHLEISALFFQSAKAVHKFSSAEIEGVFSGKSPLLLVETAQNPGLGGCWKRSSPWSGSWWPRTCCRWFHKGRSCPQSSRAPSGWSGQGRQPQGTCHSWNPQPRSIRWHIRPCQRWPSS